jgi:hypothetical protein
MSCEIPSHSHSQEHMQDLPPPVKDPLDEHSPSLGLSHVCSPDPFYSVMADYILEQQVCWFLFK